MRDIHEDKVEPEESKDERSWNSKAMDMNEDEVELESEGLEHHASGLSAAQKNGVSQPEEYFPLILDHQTTTTNHEIPTESTPKDLTLQI
jgi:hypothetical protein